MTTTDISAIWNEVLSIVRAELNTPSFKTWFEHTAPTELTDDGVFVVGVQNDFARAWLEERYSQRLSAALAPSRRDGHVGANRCRSDTSPLFQTSEVDSCGRGHGSPSRTGRGRLIWQSPPQLAPSSDFDPKYTFDSFVVGESNRFARNAARAVAEAPA